MLRAINDGTTTRRPAPAQQHHTRREPDYRQATIDMLSQVEDSFIQRMIFEIVRSIVTNIDKFPH